MNLSGPMKDHMKDQIKDQIKDKLKSQRGASILMALLLLLVCVMVAASVLMAAASNAGKAGSIREEHQHYLAVSSALQLVADDLKAASYQGHYTLSIVTQGEGEDTVETRVYNQTEGSYDAQLSAFLLGDLDYLFGEEMKADLIRLEDPDDYTLTLRGAVGTVSEHTFTVTPHVEGLEDTPVTVTVALYDSYALYLTATEGGYTMQAELTPTGTAPHIAIKPETTGARSADGGGMTWKLGWIKKGGEG